MSEIIFAIPGFLMKRFINCKNTGDSFITITPDWYKCDSLSELAHSLVLDLTKTAKRKRCYKFYLYGFSVGADIIMEVINNNDTYKLLDKMDITFILADPNTSNDTCTITREVSGCSNLTEFRLAIRNLMKEATIEEKENIEVYLEALQEAEGSKWQKIKNLANSITDCASERYDKFIKNIDKMSETVDKSSNQRVRLFFSKPSEGGFSLPVDIASTRSHQEGNHWYYSDCSNIVKICQNMTSQ